MFLSGYATECMHVLTLLYERTFLCKEKKLIMQVCNFINPVTPKLEYSNQAWNPYKKKECRIVE